MTTYLDPACHVRVLQNQDLAREAARARLIAAATSPSLSTTSTAPTTPRPVGRVRSGLRQAVAVLAAVVAVG
jgi:hypothetical protein